MIFKLNGKKQKELVDLDSAEEETGLVQLPNEPHMRAIGLIGDVDEEKAGELIYGMLALKETGRTGELDKKGNFIYEPFEFLLSTNGGSASDMFAIYDVMRQVKKDCPIYTVGLGKVMSAGVLLLAAGTKGQRKIGKNCRVMIHSVLAGSEGPLHNLESELNEIRYTQERYIQALIDETKITQKIMNKLLEKHVNIYLSAEEAIKYGIADEVI